MVKENLSFSSFYISMEFLQLQVPFVTCTNVLHMYLLFLQKKGTLKRPYIIFGRKNDATLLNEKRKDVLNGSAAMTMIGFVVSEMAEHISLGPK